MPKGIVCFSLCFSSDGAHAGEGDSAGAEKRGAFQCGLEPECPHCSVLQCKPSPALDAAPQLAGCSATGMAPFSCCCFLSATNAHVQSHISNEFALALLQRQAMQWVLVCTLVDVMLLRCLAYIPSGTMCCCKAYICCALVSVLSQLTNSAAIACTLNTIVALMVTYFVQYHLWLLSSCVHYNIFYTLLLNKMPLVLLVAGRCTSSAGELCLASQCHDSHL